MGVCVCHWACYVPCTTHAAVTFSYALLGDLETQASLMLTVQTVQITPSQNWAL